jgi:hypothetical protein
VQPLGSAVDGVAVRENAGPVQGERQKADFSDRDVEFGQGPVQPQGDLSLLGLLQSQVQFQPPLEATGR